MMKSPEPGHVLEKIRACLDGELSVAEAEAVRAHCRECPQCAQAWEELAAFADLLPGDVTEVPSSSLWPAVHARLHPRSSWFSGARFAVSASAAAAVGLLLGVLLGGVPGLERTEAAESSFTSLESVWTEDWEPTLADVYLAALTEESE